MLTALETGRAGPPGESTSIVRKQKGPEWGESPGHFTWSFKGKSKQGRLHNFRLASLSHFSELSAIGIAPSCLASGPGVALAEGCCFLWWWVWERSSGPGLAGLRIKDKLKAGPPLSPSMTPYPPSMTNSVLFCSVFQVSILFCTSGHEVVIVTDAQNALSLVKLGPAFFGDDPLVFGNFLLSGITQRTRFILYISCPRPGASYFSQEPWILEERYFKITIWAQGSNPHIIVLKIPILKEHWKKRFFYCSLYTPLYYLNFHHVYSFLSFICCIQIIPNYSIEKRSK